MKYNKHCPKNNEIFKKIVKLKCHCTQIQVLEKSKKYCKYCEYCGTLCHFFALLFAVSIFTIFSSPRHLGSGANNFLRDFSLPKCYSIMDIHITSKKHYVSSKTPQNQTITLRNTISNSNKQQNNRI